MLRWHGSLGPGSYEPIYKEWTKSDRPGALQSVEKIAPGKMREAALRGVLDELARKDDLSVLYSTMRRFSEEIPKERMATLIAGAVHDEENRSGLLINTFSDEKPAPRPATRWLLEDQAAAKEWLGRNELPEDLRKEFGD